MPRTFKPVMCTIKGLEVPFRPDGAYSDMLIHAHGNSIKIHKLLVASQSPWLAAKPSFLYETVVEVDCESSQDLCNFVSVLYSGNIEAMEAEDREAAREMSLAGREAIVVVHNVYLMATAWKMNDLRAKLLRRVGELAGDLVTGREVPRALAVMRDVGASAYVDADGHSFVAELMIDAMLQRLDARRGGDDFSELVGAAHIGKPFVRRLFTQLLDTSFGEMSQKNCNRCLRLTAVQEFPECRVCEAKGPPPYELILEEDEWYYKESCEEEVVEDEGDWNFEESPKKEKVVDNENGWDFEESPKKDKFVADENDWTFEESPEEVVGASDTVSEESDQVMTPYPFSETGSFEERHLLINLFRESL